MSLPAIAIPFDKVGSQRTFDTLLRMCRNSYSSPTNSVVFSAKSVGQRTTDIRTLGKVLQVTKMLVLDEKRGLQMSIFGPRNTI